MIIRFLDENCHSFLSSALFLSRKRFLAVIDAISLVKRVWSQDTLDIFWSKYISHYKFNDHAPKNPIYESVKFCNYIKMNETISFCERMIVEFEEAKISTILSYNTCKNTYDVSSSYRIENLYNNDTENYRFFSHESMRIVRFDGNISELIKYYKNNTSDLTAPEILTQTPEHILFYKNYKIGKVISLKCPPSLIELINVINRSSNVEDVILELISKCIAKSRDECIRLFNTLLNNGIIYVSEDKENKNVQ